MVECGVLFEVQTEFLSIMFRVVFWVLIPCNPEDNSEHHTRRRENLKSHILKYYLDKLRLQRVNNKYVCVTTLASSIAIYTYNIYLI
jgi:hypothetical protein